MSCVSQNVRLQIRLRILCAALVVMVCAPAMAFAMQAGAAKVSLPAAIEAAFKKAYPTAVIKDVSKETEDGKTVYEVESTDNGLARDLVYLTDGTVLSYEEAIPVASLPAAVSAAITARYPKATISAAEKAFSKGVMNYEVVLKGAGVTEVELTPEGKWISPAIKLVVTPVITQERS